MCLPEAAQAVSDCAGTSEDNMFFSQELDDNSLACPLHPVGHKQGTWSAVSLHLKYTACT